MNRKIIFAVTIVVLVLVGAGGYFWWTKQGLTPEEKEFELKKRVVTNYEEKHPEYIHFKETGEGKIILENTKDKIKFEIPEGWKVELSIPEENYFIKFYSPDVLKTIIPGELKEGECMFGLGFYDNSTIDVLKEEFLNYIQDLKESYPESDLVYKENSIEFLGYPAWFISTELFPIEPPTNTIFVAVNDKIHEFWYVNWGECPNQFEHFKTTIKIK